MPERYIDVGLIDPSHPLFRAILRSLHNVTLAPSSLARYCGESARTIQESLDLLDAHGVTVPHGWTSGGQLRRGLSGWGDQWVAIVREWDRRSSCSKQTHHADLIGRPRPSRSYWCGWCAARFGVPHDHHHEPGQMCRYAYRRDCACIDAWVLGREEDRR